MRVRSRRCGLGKPNDASATLEAFRYGVPPHGGIAPGVDCLVMVLREEPNIREVMAFPKTQGARDEMMHAPGPIAEEQLKEQHIKTFSPRKVT